MPRFFVNKSSVDDEKNIIKIEGEDFNHLVNVLRCKVTDQLTVCDGTGFDYEGEILLIEKNHLIVKILDKQPSKTEPNIPICLFQGIPKGDKMEQVIQKSVELGVTEIVPVICKRTIVKFNDKSKANKVKRWRRVAYEASKQCNRSVVPNVNEPLSFKEAVEFAAKYKIKLIPYEEEKNNSIKVFLKELSAPESTAVFIGPEGGFDEEEIELAKDNDFVSVTLGERILRTETAGPVVLGILRYEYED